MIVSPTAFCPTPASSVNHAPDTFVVSFFSGAPHPHPRLLPSTPSPPRRPSPPHRPHEKPERHVRIPVRREPVHPKVDDRVPHRVLPHRRLVRERRRVCVRDLVLVRRPECPPLPLVQIVAVLGPARREVRPVPVRVLHHLPRRPRRHARAARLRHTLRHEHPRRRPRLRQRWNRPPAHRRIDVVPVDRLRRRRPVQLQQIQVVHRPRRRPAHHQPHPHHQGQTPPPPSRPSRPLLSVCLPAHPRLPPPRHRLAGPASGSHVPHPPRHALPRPPLPCPSHAGLSRHGVWLTVWSR